MPPLAGQELFSDVTGDLDALAQERLEAPPGTCFYQVLALYYEMRPEEAWPLLGLCRQLWAKRLVAAAYTLLLHRWLLGGSSGLEAGERVRHLQVLFKGAGGLFQGDMLAGHRRFLPLLQFLYEGVLLKPAAAAAALQDESMVRAGARRQQQQQGRG